MAESVTFRLKSFNERRLDEFSTDGTGRAESVTFLAGSVTFGAELVTRALN